MSFIETDLGYLQEKDGYLIFFGKSSATLEQIKQAYPDLTFRTVHQKHTDVCVASAADSQETVADAHFSSESGLALIVKTADCMPIMAYSKQQKIIISIHAGWRGVENQITAKAFKAAHLSEAEVFFGPHILQKSFEVDPDVKEQLEKTYLLFTKSPEAAVFQAKENKFYIDLKAIVKQQLKSLAIPFHLHELPIDTVSNPQFHSYRRDKQASGRNLSFIARLKS